MHDFLQRFPNNLDHLLVDLAGHAMFDRIGHGLLGDAVEMRGGGVIKICVKPAVAAAIALCWLRQSELQPQRQQQQSGGSASGCRSRSSALLAAVQAAVGAVAAAAAVAVAAAAAAAAAAVIVVGTQQST